MIEHLVSAFHSAHRSLSAQALNRAVRNMYAERSVELQDGGATFVVLAWAEAEPDGVPALG